MTRFIEKSLGCAVCGKENKYSLLASSNTMDYSDLDTRPAEMARRAELFLVQSCPFCGFCSTDISAKNAQAVAVVASESYQDMLTDPALLEIARHWICCSLIEEAGSDFPTAGWCTIRAAWVCDDAQRKDASNTLRRRAVTLFLRAREEGTSFAQDQGSEQIILADLLRRSGGFRAALETCDQGFQWELSREHAQILAFQKTLITQKDRGCYTIGQALQIPSLSEQLAEEEQKLTAEERHLVAYVLGYFQHLITRYDMDEIYQERSLLARFAVCQRIAKKHASEVYANRCPNCGRLPRTPRAKQCFWCGHHWREAA